MQSAQDSSESRPIASGDTSLRILVADDHALFRAGLRHLLKDSGGEPEIVEARDHQEASQCLAQRQDFDLLLLDLNMPGMEGFQGLRQLCAQAPDVPIVVVSVRDRADDVRRALDAGAMGYIPKSSTPEVMVSALQLVLSGGVYLPPNLLSDPGDEPEADGTDDGGAQAGLLKRLTPRQRDVLALLAEGKSNKEIAEVLGLAPGTVKIHISRILRAFGVQNRTQAVIAAAAVMKWGNGAGK
jgi:DNA-binding NarL/FixJ family response regulator